MIRYDVVVSSLSAGPVRRGLSYIALPGIQGIDTLNLQFVEAKAYVNRVMAAQGYVQARQASEADLAIFVSYGIGDPATQSYTYSSPVFGQIPATTTNFSGTIQSGGSTANVSGQATSQSQWGLLGFQTLSGTRTTFTRFLLMVAIDVPQFARDKTWREVWRSAAISTGSSSDLRLVLPVLFVGIEPYLGRRTDRAISSTIREDDLRLALMRGAASHGMR
jgi:hypothetical protein